MRGWSRKASKLHWRDAQAALTRARRLQQGLPHSSLVGQTWFAIGRVQQRAGRGLQSRQAYERAIEQLVPTVGAEHEHVVQARQTLQTLR
jgi:hypothetical protein